MNNDIAIFYDEYVDTTFPDAKFVKEHLNILHWRDLKKNISACDRLQRKPFYKIAILNGKGMYKSNDKTITIDGPTIVFTEPLARFSFNTQDADFEGIYCVCSDSFLRGTSKLNLRNWPVFRQHGISAHVLDKESYQLLYNKMVEIEEEISSDYPFKEQLIRNRIFDIIHYVQKSIKYDVSVMRSLEDSLDERFFKVLENTFYQVSPSKPLGGKTPAYFAGILHTTVDYLNQTIKKMTGKTTQRIIYERLIEEANVLLSYSDLSIKEIAWALNFQESSHFINYYRKFTGKTPMAYRKI